jgi:hypothetical protein
MTSSKGSLSIISDIGSRVQKPMSSQQVSLETGIDLTNENMKTQNDGPESPNSPSFNLSQSSDSEELDKQAAQSIISGLSSVSNFSLVSTIKQKNFELKLQCKEKLQDLHITTKEFCVRNRSNSKIILASDESTDSQNQNLKSPQDMKRSKSDPCLSTVLSELSQLRKQLDQANQKISESRHEMERQNEENKILRTQLGKIISGNGRVDKLQTCDCNII